LDLSSRIEPSISLLIVIVYIEVRVLKSAFQASVTSLEQNGLLFKPCSTLVPACAETHRERVPTHQSTLFLYLCSSCPPSLFKFWDLPTTLASKATSVASAEVARRITVFLPNRALGYPHTFTISHYNYPPFIGIVTSGPARLSFALMRARSSRVPNGFFT